MPVDNGPWVDWDGATPLICLNFPNESDEGRRMRERFCDETGRA